MTENFNSLAKQIADLLDNKTVGEIIKLFEVASNAFLFEVILRKIADRMKNGVKLSLKEKKCLTENLMKNSNDPKLADLLFNILEINEEEPPAKRKKLAAVVQSGRGDENATTSSDVAHEMEMVPINNSGASAPIIAENNGSVEKNASSATKKNHDEISDIHESSSSEENDADHTSTAPEFVKVIKKEKKYSEFFKMSQLDIHFNLIRPNDETTNQWWEMAFQNIIDIISNESPGPNDKVIMQIYHVENPTLKPVYIGMRTINTLSTDVILDNMEKIHQSTTAFHTTDMLGARAFVFRAMDGKGRHHGLRRMDATDIRKYKQKSIIDPGTKENCLLIAMIFDMTNTDRCMHSDDERLLSGFWALDEIRLAVENGYKIFKSHEVWVYETVQYNRETGEQGLFSGFVDNFLKIKQEASGWPIDTVTEQQKDDYIQEYFEKEGVQLDKNKICVNKGMRSLAKIVLNSLWGRFIMRDDYGKTTICNSLAELNEIVSSEDISIMDLYPAGEKQIFVSWKHIDVANPVQKNTNMGVGICTTTNARIKLYSILSKLGRNILYCDTDSVIFVVPAGQKNPLQCGKFLGDLTDELVDYGEGAYIEEYVSTGPKSYGLKIYSPKNGSHSYKIVCKGISMNRLVEQKVNFDTLKHLVMGDTEEITVTYDNKIERKKYFQIQSGPSKKKLQFTFNKRRCIEDFETEPFGY
ncbi:Beta-mannosidase [Sergentomyia squamirostris]